MKKFLTFFTIVLFLTNCKKSDLKLDDPNSPTPVGALASVKGVEQFAMGMWYKLRDGNSGLNLLSHSIMMHSCMGDEQFTSAGNWGWRHITQVNKITLPAPYNNVVPNVLVITQAEQLKALNTLAATNGNQNNALVYEWNMAYYVNGQANFLLAAIENPTLTLSASKKATLQAWAYWWKGFAYSRIGSMYLAGVINNKTDGTTESTYVTRDAIIVEANANFDKAAALLAPLTAGDAEYKATLNAVIPIFNKPSATFEITPQMWIRGINTAKARNLLVNKKVTALAAADLTQIKTLASAGLVQGDITFLFGISAVAAEGIVANNQMHPYLWNNNTNNAGWNIKPSERLVQDFKAGDQRRVKGISTLAVPVVDNQSRGIHYGTRYDFTPIQSGGFWTSLGRTGVGSPFTMSFAGSWEENALMLAEVEIRNGQIEAGLAYVDAVRTAQAAGLGATVGTGLNQTQALEELRSERRIGLLLKGLAFYDARRWGITEAGKGRQNAIVLVPNSIIGLTPTGGATPLPCFVDYNYLDYWDVPVSEFSYNPPASGGPAIAN